MIFLIWTIVLIAVIWIYLRKAYSRFNDTAVRHRPIVPLFGNLFRILFQLDSFTDDLDKSYEMFPNDRFIGRYEFMKPTILVRDIELTKNIAIKDFEYFIDHRHVVDEDIEPLFARNLVCLKGQEWKDMRSTLSPAFTSSKIKLMIPFMEEVGAQMIKVLTEKITKSDDEFVEIDCKDLTTRFTNDVIASCAFGLKVDSHTDEDNNFYKMGKASTSFSFKQILVIFIATAFPWLTKTFKLTMFKSSTKKFFMDLVLGTMKDRETRNIIRPDMIHLLMEARKGKLKHEEKESDDKDTGFATVEESDVGKKTTNKVWSDIDVVAQAFLFFTAGFETISTLMSFALHELAVNPEVQDRLVEEIKKLHEKNNGKMDFTSIQNLVYMDMVTSEVLRYWPPALALDRLCVKDYNMGKPNSEATKDYIIRKGEVLGIPIWSFHRDPQFFENPNKFDPERFSNENKHKINPDAYIPFGIGPRNCIGSRFALCELKVFLYQILLNFEISPSSKTILPSKISKESFNLKLEGGHWLNFKIRSATFNE